MQIIRKSSFIPKPWKNGGGITHEALRMPAGGTEFRWRVSIAQIDISGPFSDFAGYNRTMVLLRGAGIRLSVGGGRQCLLREAGDLAEFDGGAATTCELLDGPCADLNLMVSKSIPRARSWVARVYEAQSLQPPLCGTTLAFAINGIVSIERDEQEATTLLAGDLAVFSPKDRVTLRTPALDESTAPLVFFAALDDNPS